MTAIVVFAAYRLGSRALTNAWTWSIAVLALVAVAVARMPFPLVIACAAAIGSSAAGSILTSSRCVAATAQRRHRTVRR